MNPEVVHEKRMSVRIILVEGIEKWRAQSGKIDHPLSSVFAGIRDAVLNPDQSRLPQAAYQLHGKCARSEIF
jgi:hypothetical protein